MRVDEKGEGLQSLKRLRSSLPKSGGNAGKDSK
jgi:hypothetical protein